MQARACAYQKLRLLDASLFSKTLDRQPQLPGLGAAFDVSDRLETESVRGGGQILKKKKSKRA